MDSSEDLVGGVIAPVAEGPSLVAAESGPDVGRSLRDAEALAARNALAAKYFPREWAAAVGRLGASKRRQQLRKGAEAQQFLEGLRAKGASCANCDSFNDKPPFGVNVSSICETHSDFRGYMVAQPDGLCLQWREKTSSPQSSTSPAPTMGEGAAE